MSGSEVGSWSGMSVALGDVPDAVVDILPISV